jgi:hypothetical protein
MDNAQTSVQGAAAATAAAAAAAAASRPAVMVNVLGNWPTWNTASMAAMVWLDSFKPARRYRLRSSQIWLVTQADAQACIQISRWCV